MNKTQWTCKKCNYMNDGPICTKCGFSPSQHDVAICQYDADYFLRGRDTGKSLYENYRWIPELTIPMVKTIIDHCGIKKSQFILDFGCARGYVVRAFRELGYQAFGIDASQWAIDNCDPGVKDVLYHRPHGNINGRFDWVIAKDVFEHVHNVADVIDKIMIDHARVGVFAVVPLSAIDGQPYIVADYEKDITHIHRLTLASWARMFMRTGWRVECSYRVNGVKDNYSQFEAGNGFITARRIP